MPQIPLSLPTLALLALLPTTAAGEPARSATSSAPAAAQAGRKQEYRSPSGSWRLLVTSGSGVEAQEPRPTTAVLNGPDGESEPFELPFPNSPFEVLLEDDGSALCFDDRQGHGIGIVLVALAPDGSVRWQRTLEELLPAEVLAQMASGISSRQWRRRPVALQWRMQDDQRAGFVLELWNADRLHVELEDGAARHEGIKDHGDDVHAWFTSARSLLAAGLVEESIPEFRRVVELDRTQLVAWNQLSSALERLGRTDEALEALRMGSLANPLSKYPDLPGNENSRRNLWLHVRLAKAYERANKTDLAERAALACTEVDPSLWEAVSIVAGAAWNRGEIDRANELLTKTWRHLAAPPNERSRKHYLSQASFRIGDFYFERTRHAEAVDYFRRGFERGEYNDALCTRLTKAHEELGQYEQAIEVAAVQLEYLMQRSAELEDPRGRQATEARIRLIEQDVARLDELSREGDQ